MKKELSLIEFPMPDSTDIECSLLNALLIDNTQINDLMRVVKPEYFSIEDNRKIWNTIIAMHDKGEQIDMVTVYPKVDMKYFVGNIMPSERTFGQGVMQLGMSLMEMHIKKSAYYNALSILQGIDKGESLEAITSYFSNFNKDLEDNLKDDRLQVPSDIADAIAKDIVEGKMTKVPTSFQTLDYMLYGGFGSGNLAIIAARPSVGKTTIALQVATHAARCGKKACFFSLEMTSKELVQRILVGTGELTQYDFATHKIDWNKFNNATATLNDNLKINDNASTLEEIGTRISLEAKAGNCEIAFVDYLGLVRHDDKRKTQAQVIGDITQTLKGKAKECNIPIVLLCQLNRESAKESRPPQLYDLRDSGNIEQDADVVIMLDRTKDDTGAAMQNKIDMWVRKNRVGRISIDEPIHLEGNDCYSNFKEVVRIYTNEENDPW